MLTCGRINAYSYQMFTPPCSPPPRKNKKNSMGSVDHVQNSTHAKLRCDSTDRENQFIIWKPNTVGTTHCISKRPLLSDTLISHSGRLITGGAGRNLRLWSVVGVAEMKLPGDNNNMRRDGLTMEDEMNLDGMIVSASFDEPLEMVR